MGGLMSRLVPKLRFKEFSGEWEEKKLGDVSNINMGQSPASSSYNNTNNGIYLIQGNADIKDRFSNPRQWTTEPTKLCDIGDLILTVRAPVGYIAKSLHKTCIGRGVCSLSKKENNNIEFIYQFLLSYEKNWVSLEQGSTFTAVSGNDIKSLKINTPIPKEQQKIASCLSSLDALIEAQNKKVSALKQHKKGLMQQLFPKSGETTPTLRFKAFSGEWEEKIISDLANRYDNLRIPIAASNRIEGVTPYYGANGIQSYIQGYTHDGEYILVAEDGANDLQNYPVQYVNGKVWVNNHTHVLQGKKGISNNIFLMHAIQNTNIRPYLVGGGRAKLNANIMMKISFLVPKPKEQQKIANTLSTLDNLIEAQNQQINHLKQHKKGLMQQLFVNSEVGA
jgi:type I restriction enzyme S subunit